MKIWNETNDESLLTTNYIMLINIEFMYKNIIAVLITLVPSEKFNKIHSTTIRDRR